jgi:hypothetical protein
LLAGAVPGVAGADAGDRVWARRWNGPRGGNDLATAIAVGSDRNVYVTGTSAAANGGDKNLATVSYDSDGIQRWATQFHGAHVRPADIVVSPDASRVFVTGRNGNVERSRFVTVAYDARDGRRLWSDGFGDVSVNEAVAMAASPNGRRVYVLGTTWTPLHGFTWATIAYDTATGRRLWVNSFGETTSGYDFAADVAVDPNGSLLYVTGSAQTLTDSSIGVVAYDARTGRRVWYHAYDASGSADANALAVAPDGGRVYATGFTGYRGGGTGGRTGDYATVALDAATGARAWVARFDSPDHLADAAEAIAVGDDGRRIFVTGSSAVAGGALAATTLSYRADTGETAWRRTYDGPGAADAAGMAIAAQPNGTGVFVVGGAGGIGPLGWTVFYTVAYGAAAGGTRWIDAYGEVDGRAAVGRAVSATPEGDRLYAAGSARLSLVHSDFVTIGTTLT